LSRKRAREARSCDNGRSAASEFRVATKSASWGALEVGLTDACRTGARELVSMWGHPDQEEGPRAFAEKRQPRWRDLDATDGSPDDHGRS